MTSITTKPDSAQPAAAIAVDLFDNWFDPIETEVRSRARGFIEELIRGELDAMLARPRYGRSPIAGDEEGAGVAGHCVKRFPEIVRNSAIRLPTISASSTPRIFGLWRERSIYH